MGISEDANAAADYIEAHGHCKGNFIRNGSVCLIGALAQGNVLKTGRFTILKNNYSEYVHPLPQAVAEHVGAIPGHLAEWNDLEERTAEEVVQVLRDVAIKHQTDEMRSS